MDRHRGHEIELFNLKWVYSDTKKAVPLIHDRPCGKCHKPNRPDDHDACLGELKGVMNACCGHGHLKEMYVQFNPKWRISGWVACIYIKIFKGAA